MDKTVITSSINNAYIDVEVTLLLQAIKARYGYDFSGYQRSMLKRRLQIFCQKQGKRYLSECISAVLYDNLPMDKVIACFSLPVTEMFRERTLFKYFRQFIIPWLATFPYINIWSAGCASGEEAYSLAIILYESGLLSRSKIYATDISATSLAQAKQGLLQVNDLSTYADNYHTSGGIEEFSKYYTVKPYGVKMAKYLHQAINFDSHNLVTDASFMTVHVAFCCNVLIYFTPQQKNQVLSLLDNSLISHGLLCLGHKESLGTSVLNQRYQPQSLPHVYRKMP